MGLGKTVEMLALMLANPYDEQLSSQRLTDKRCPFPNPKRLKSSRATLVIVPQHLLGHWRDQIKKCLGLESARVLIWDAKRSGSGWAADETEIHVHVKKGQKLGIKLGVNGCSMWVRELARGSAAAQLDVFTGDLQECIRVDDDILKLFLPVSKGSGSGKWTTADQFIKGMIEKGGPQKTTVSCEALQAELERLAATPNGLKLMLGRSLRPASTFSDSDIVLTTPRVFEQPSPLNSVHWWRVVLDESQRIKEPKGQGAFERFPTADKLSRVHSWLMSGTPVGGVVDDLLGQLLFLGVEPYCRMGPQVHNLWRDVVTERYKVKDPEALEIVTGLLSQIMMRHSKKQAQALGELQMPEVVIEIVALDFLHPSEHAVYSAIEAYAQEEAQRMMTHKTPLKFQNDLDELMEMLQAAATHVSLVKLQRLDRRLQNTMFAARPEWDLDARSGDRARHSKGLWAPKCFLREVVRDMPSDTPGHARLVSLLCEPVDFSCTICSSAVEDINDPVLVDCCQTIFCKECVYKGQPHTEVKCPQCRKSLGFENFTNLCQPLDARLSGSTVDFVAPALKASNEALARAPPRQEVGRLRVWECAGGQRRPREKEKWEDTDMSCADGFLARKPVKFMVDGLHFCSHACVDSAFDRAIEKTQQGFRLKKDMWAGKLAGKCHTSKVCGHECLACKYSNLANLDAARPHRPS